MLCQHGKRSAGNLSTVSANEDMVTKWRKSSANRSEKEERVKFQPQLCLDMTNINFITTKSVVTVDEFLDIDEKNYTINPNYHLLKSNCKLFVRDARNQLDLMAGSTEIKFALPGSGGEKVTIDDPKVIQHLEHMYANLTSLVEIPEVEEQFIAYVRETHLQEGIDYDTRQHDIETLKFHQKMYSFVLKIVRNWSRAQGNNHASGQPWRVVLNNIAPDRVKSALQSASMPLLNVESISDFWKESFDILVFAPEIGCVIIDFDKKGKTAKSSYTSLIAKKDMLAELGDVDTDIKFLR